MLDRSGGFSKPRAAPSHRVTIGGAAIASAMFTPNIMSSSVKFNTTVMAVSPNDMTTNTGFESVKRQLKIVGKNVVSGAADAGSLIVEISDNTGMDAADAWKM